MRTSKVICIAVGAMLAATAMSADETVVVSHILGPEGPLYVDDNLEPSRLGTGFALSGLG